MLLLVIVRDHRSLSRYAYTLGLVGIILVLIPALLPAQSGPVTSEVNGAKLLASEALWAAADAAFDTFGGYAAAEEYGIERRWKGARLPRTAPISNNIVLAGIAHGTLGLPKSF